LSKDDTFLNYGDQLGTVVAWKVAEEAILPTPIMAPTLEDPIPPMEAPVLKATFTAVTVFSQLVVNFAQEFNNIQRLCFVRIAMEGYTNEFGGRDDTQVSTTCQILSQQFQIEGNVN
jgi:hypothetical protein